MTDIIANEGFEPVRNIAINEDWLALRFLRVENIKKKVRKFTHSKVGKECTNDQ
ncbi:hypothetical protein [Psychrobacillus glaciei]|uniref:hypothetical protein n=1 Tax=Psychrobacillus glaciei TaxID=2283160 RepID=UPI001CEFAB62|nr:hypothetical protein [Psychrobacillus glaciei]